MGPEAGFAGFGYYRPTSWVPYGYGYFGNYGYYGKRSADESSPNANAEAEPRYSVFGYANRPYGYGNSGYRPNSYANRPYGYGNSGYRPNSYAYYGQKVDLTNNIRSFP